MGRSRRRARPRTRPTGGSRSCSPRERCVMLDGGMGTELGRTCRPTRAPREDEALWGTWALVHAARTRSRDVHRALHRGRLRRDLHEHVGRAQRDGRRHAAARTRRRCTGWTSRGAACASAREAIERGRPRGRGGARVQHQRRRRQRGAQGDARAAAARVRGGPAGPHPARDDDAGPQRADVRRRSRRCVADRASRCGSASAAAATACAASSASTGAARRATSSAAWRAASRRSGVRALLINCLPPDHVPGMLPWLRDFTDLPLGVYPNLGY